MNSSLPLPPNLTSKLADFRRRVWLVKLAEGLLAAVFGLAISYLFVLVLDRFFDTPAWLRGLFLAAGAAVPGLGLPLKWHKWVWRQRGLEDAARLLRWKFPRLGDQLLGIVELAKEDSAFTGRSERLVQAAMAQADEAVKDQDFSNAVPQATHRQWAWAALGATALIVTGFMAINEAARNALARWLMPWSETERFTFARVEALPNPLAVPLAEPFTLPVSLAPDSRWKPEGARGKIAGQPAIQATRQDAAFALAFPPQTRDAEISLKVGDVRESIRVEPRPRPELTTLSVRQKLPDYLQYKSEPVTEVRGGAVSLLRGAQATFEATASRALAHAEVDGQPVKVEGQRLISAPQVLLAERDVTFAWRDELGLTPKTPLVLKVQAKEDEAPQLVARRETMEQVVLDSEVVVFEVSTSDDFGVRQMGLEWKGLDAGRALGTDKTKGSKVAAAGAPETKALESRATFCAKREGIAPQSLEIRAWAEDYLPSRERSRSAAFLLHVLNETDHALWVTQQMGKWLEVARETYEREQQLHETNKELRALSATDLDRPDNRRKIAQQSAAENANAERLGSLTNAGRNLVEQATKNPEFEAERLESWALMLKSLQDIADNRMPSVADLLRQSADAKADAKPGQSGPSQSPPSSPASSPADPAGQSNKDAQTAQNDPNSGQGKQGVPQDGKTAPTLSTGPSSPKGTGPQSASDPDAKPPEPAPSLAVKESTMTKPDPAAAQPAGGPKPPSAATLGLPSNSLANIPKRTDGQEQPPAPPQSTAQEKLDQGIAEQRDLLAEFAKVSDQLSEILASLQASTFVKRLKAASREQTQLASGMSEQTLNAFGIVRENPAMALQNAPAGEVEKEVAEGIASFFGEILGVKKARAKPAEEPKPELVAAVPEAPFVTTYAPVVTAKSNDQSEVVKIIQSDLEAYFQRKQDMHFKKVIGEMKQTRVVQELKRVGVHAADNFSGNAIHGAEYWADTLDRWAEEMVAAASAFC